MAKVDEDLVGTWEYVPRGIEGVERKGGIDVYEYTDDYGEPPFRFRPFKQNGSRVWLRLLTPDGKDARFADDHEFLAGRFVERRCYSSDMRRGIYWRRLA